VNCTNLFDAACGFAATAKAATDARVDARAARIHGTGMVQERANSSRQKSIAPFEPESDDDSTASDANPPRSTARQALHSGKQARPDSGYSMEVRAAMDDCWGSSAGNRKDIRNAVEAARKATAWRKLRRTIARRFSTTARRIFPSAATRLHIAWPTWSAKSRRPRKWN